MQRRVKARRVFPRANRSSRLDLSVARKIEVLALVLEAELAGHQALLRIAARREEPPSAGLRGNVLTPRGEADVTVNYAGVLGVALETLEVVDVDGGMQGDRLTFGGAGRGIRLAEGQRALHRLAEADPDAFVAHLRRLGVKGKAVASHSLEVSLGVRVTDVDERCGVDPSQVEIRIEGQGILRLDQMQANGPPVPVYRLALGNPPVDLLDELELLEEMPVGAELDHVDVLVDDSILIPIDVPYAPHHAKLLRPAADGLHEIGVLDPDGIEVEATVPRHRGHVNRQGNAGHEQVEVHFLVRDHFVGLARVVADIEGALHPGGGADFFNVDSEVRKHSLEDALGVAQGRHVPCLQIVLDRHERNEIFDVK